MNPTPVDRCVCRQIRFADLIRMHRETGAGFDELQRQTGCGAACGLCAPYIRVALATGRARLPVMSEAQLRELGGFGPG